MCFLRCRKGREGNAESLSDLCPQPHGSHVTSNDMNVTLLLMSVGICITVKTKALQTYPRMTVKMVTIDGDVHKFHIGNKNPVACD